MIRTQRTFFTIGSLFFGFWALFIGAVIWLLFHPAVIGGWVGAIVKGFTEAIK